MKKSEKFKKKVDNFLFDHYHIRNTLNYLRGFLIAAITAFIFAVGFTIFVEPSASADPQFTIATGGVSGISQIINLIYILIVGKPIPANILLALSYSALNLPILIFGFFKVGKRFAIETAFNVGLSSLFIWLLSTTGVAEMISSNSLWCNSLITRVLLAGICVGLSSSLAFKADISCGGIDVITYYLALRKSTSVGKYGLTLNCCVITVYAILLTFSPTSTNWTDAVVSFFSSVIYIIVVNLVVDAINVRNKKIQIQLITTKEFMADVLLANFPHGATYTNGTGAYSGKEKKIIWVVVSSSEVNKVIKVAKKVDEHVFITVTPLNQVYGNFFIKPVA